MTAATAEREPPSEDALRPRLRIEVARQLSKVNAWLEEHETDAATRAEALSEALANVAAAHPPTGGWAPEALTFDFDAPPPPPVWVIDKLIERENVVVLSGDTGAAKSIISTACIPAALAGAPWMGHETHIERVLVVDEEDPARVVRARLKALGMTNDHRDRLRYFNREGFALAPRGASDAAFRAELEAHQPDLVLVNSLMAACDLSDVNSNTEAVAMIKYLRELAREFHCGMLLIHHERKRPREGAVSSSGQEALGARQWMGQADGQMTMTVETELVEEPVEDSLSTDPHIRLRRTFKWRTAEKDRDGRRNRLHRVAVESEKDSGGALIWMTVTDEGEIEAAATEEDALADEIGAFVQREAREVATGEIAAAIGRSADDGTFKRALKRAVDGGQVVKPGKGRYAPGETVSGLPIG